MSKRDVRRWWMAGFGVELVAFVASLVVPILTKPERILHGHARLAFSILITCLLVALGGVAVQVAAWVKAVSITSAAGDERWHRRLLKWGIIGGLLMPLLGLGAFICWWVMVDYLRNGPDRVIRPATRRDRLGVPVRARSRVP